MKPGVLQGNIYRRSVAAGLHFHRDEIIDGAASRGVCASFVVGDSESIVMGSSFQAAFYEKKGQAAIAAAVNHMAAEGHRPIAVNVTILMPVKYSEEKLKTIVAAIDDMSLRMEVEVANISGELLEGIDYPVVVASAIGIKNNSNRFAKAGDAIIMTKYAGAYGASVIAEHKKKELSGRFSTAYIEGAALDEAFASVQKECSLAGKSGAHMMIAVGKGGVDAALWELAESQSVGLRIVLRDIPIKQETVEVCNYFDVNPYELYSEGCLLIVTDREDKMLETLQAEGITAAVIGRVTDDNDKLIINDYEERYLTKPVPDGLTTISFYGE